MDLLTPHISAPKSTSSEESDLGQFELSRWAVTYLMGTLAIAKWVFQLSLLLSYLGKAYFQSTSFSIAFAAR